MLVGVVTPDEVRTEAFREDPEMQEALAASLGPEGDGAAISGPSNGNPLSPPSAIPMPSFSSPAAAAAGASSSAEVHPAPAVDLRNA